jgi:type I restriction enzyme S subunit
VTRWPTVPFDEAVDDVTGGNPKTPQSQYADKGAFPIVDQGQRIIAGYIDDPTALFGGPLPVIAFGDHTRAFKYVNFPFAVGADGLKLLRARDGFEARYVYHFLASISLPAAGYSRHFKFLKEVAIPRPPLSDQRRIVQILDQTDDLLIMRRHSMTVVEQLNQSVFLEMFGDPRHALERARPLSTVIDPSDRINYGVVQPGDDVDGGVPLVRVGDLRFGRVRHDQLKRISPEVERRYARSRLRGTEILLSCVGSTGVVAVVSEAEIGFNVARAVTRIPISDALVRAYVAEYLRSDFAQSYFRSELRTVSQPTLNGKQIAALPVLMPSARALSTYSSRLQGVAAQLARARTAEQALLRLRRSLNHSAFAGLL